MSNQNSNPSESGSPKKEKQSSVEFGIGPSALQFFKQQQEMQAKWTSLSSGLYPSKETWNLSETVRKIETSMPKPDPRVIKAISAKSFWYDTIPVSPALLDTLKSLQETNKKITSNFSTNAMSAAMLYNTQLVEVARKASVFSSFATKGLRNYVEAEGWPLMRSFEFEGENFTIADIDLEVPADDQSDDAPSPILEESSRVHRIITDIFHQDQTLLQLEPHIFEEVVAELLRSQGFEVNLTKRTRDGGYDLVALTKQGGFPLKFLVECKRYTTEKIGIEIVRNLMYVVKQEEANKGIIATTSYFSKDAHVHQQSTHPYLLDLRDRTDILSWIQQYGESVLRLRRPAH